MSQSSATTQLDEQRKLALHTKIKLYVLLQSDRENKLQEELRKVQNDLYEYRACTDRVWKAVKHLPDKEIFDAFDAGMHREAGRLLDRMFDRPDAAGDMARERLRDRMVHSVEFDMMDATPGSDVSPAPKQTASGLLDSPRQDKPSPKSPARPTTRVASGLSGSSEHESPVSRTVSPALTSTHVPGQVPPGSSRPGTFQSSRSIPPGRGYSAFATSRGQDHTWKSALPRPTSRPSASTPDATTGRPISALDKFQHGRPTSAVASRAQQNATPVPKHARPASAATKSESVFERLRRARPTSATPTPNDIRSASTPDAPTAEPVSVFERLQRGRPTATVGSRSREQAPPTIRGNEKKDRKKIEPKRPRFI